VSEEIDLLHYEKLFLDRGLTHIAGVDEAGRGAWAGPVMAGAVILPLDRADLFEALEGVRDSKLCTPLQRERLYPVVREVALAVGVGTASAAEVDRDGVVAASKAAMRRAVADLPIAPDALLIDGGYMGLKQIELPQEALVKGELKSISIAAASIIAKVERDRAMVEMGEEWAAYGFERHKGYGTVQHRAALDALGPMALHRRTFKPIRRALGQEID
jgi:ribonuclease HII